MLILRHLQRTCGTQLGQLSWKRGNIVVHKHMRFFYVTYTPVRLFALIFLLLFLPFWASSPHIWCTCCPSPIWNGPCMNFESSPVWALLRRQGLGSTRVVASQDLTPRGGLGGTFPLRTPKWFYGTMGIVGFSGNLLNSAKQNLWWRVRVL